METLPFLGSVAGVAAVVAILIQLFKPYLPDEQSIRLAAVVLGIALALGWAAVTGVAGPADWLTVALRGLYGGVLAVGGFSIVNSAAGKAFSRSPRR